MKFCRNIKNCDAFTLLEVLLAVSILGIMFITVMGFFSQSFQYTQKNESKTVGIHVARNVLNYIEKQNFTTIHTKLNKQNPLDKEISVTANKCEEVLSTNCSFILKSTINNVNYDATVKLSKHADIHLQPYLIAAEVKISWDDKTTTVKGVIKK